MKDDTIRQIFSLSTAPGAPGFNGEYRAPVTGHNQLGNGKRTYAPELMRFPGPGSMSASGAGWITPYAYGAGGPIYDSAPQVTPEGRDSAREYRRMKAILGFQNITGEASRTHLSNKVNEANERWNKLPNERSEKSLESSSKHHVTFEDNYVFNRNDFARKAVIPSSSRSVGSLRSAGNFRYKVNQKGWILNVEPISSNNPSDPYRALSPELRDLFEYRKQIKLTGQTEHDTPMIWELLLSRV